MKESKFGWSSDPNASPNWRDELPPDKRREVRRLDQQVNDLQIKRRIIYQDLCKARKREAQNAPD